MKRIIYCFIIGMMAFTLAIGTVPANAASKKIKLNKTKATVEVGQNVKLKLRNATAGKVTWKSSDRSIATVSKKGVVKGIAPGKVTITAKYKKKTYKCVVTVKYAEVPDGTYSLHASSHYNEAVNSGNTPEFFARVKDGVMTFDGCLTCYDSNWNRVTILEDGVYSIPIANNLLVTSTGDCVMVKSIDWFNNMYRKYSSFESLPPTVTIKNGQVVGIDICS